MIVGDCLRCLGCGRLAPTPEAPSLSLWLNLPASAGQLRYYGNEGTVCPDCGGSGKNRDQLRAQDTENHLDPAQVLCPDCMDRGWSHKTVSKRSDQGDYEDVAVFSECQVCCKLVGRREAEAFHSATCGCERQWIYIPRGQ